ncbi:MAG: thiamine pyrophosphate-dependent enzyme [Rhodospirillaceae bacterium]|jgi:thiamine pyrophosphate-dependent acetolactate synthase large subunit-like protein
MSDITLDRRELIPALFPNPENYLFITGLAGPAKDVCAHTGESENVFSMGGAMGSAIPTALGAALSAPSHEVVCVTGDGELMMAVGSLATVSSMSPQNLSIICIDNGCHGETGGQWGHTSRLTDLAKMAEGAGIPNVMTISSAEELGQAKSFLEAGQGPRFLWARVLNGPPSKVARNWNLIERRQIFKDGFAARAAS